MRLASDTTATPRSRKPRSGPRPGRELALAAVDHDQVRAARRSSRRRRGRAGRCRPGAPTGRSAARAPRPSRRSRRGSPRSRADREAAVVGLLRRPALEHDHRGDRVRAAEVGDVEALDPDRRHVEVERPLQALRAPPRGSGVGARSAAAPGRAPGARCARPARGSGASRRARPRAARPARRGGWRARRPAPRARPSSRWTTSSAGIDMCPP